jgi:hypothetical protein
MSNSYICPFFRKVREGGKINCEFATIKPPDKESFDEFVENYCANETDYKNCVFYKLLDEYYERKYAEEEKDEQRAD